MAQKQVEEQKFNPEQFISKNHVDILTKNNLQLQVRYADGIYKAYVVPLEEGMTDEKIAHNLKRSLNEIADQSIKVKASKEQAISFNFIMGTLVEKADNKTIEKIKNTDQKLLAEEFKKVLNDSNVNFGSKGSDSSHKEGDKISDNSREVWLITQKQLDTILSNIDKIIKQRQFESTHITKNENKKLVEKLYKNNDKTASNKNAIYMATEQGQTGAVKAYCNKQIQDELIKKQKEFNEKFEDLEKHNNDKFFFEKDGNKIMVTMVHHDGKSKKEVLYDENGLNRQTALNLYEVANLYTNHKDPIQQKNYDNISKANDLGMGEKKEIRNLITEMVFSIPGVKEAYEQADVKYRKDNPGYHLSKDGFAAGYLNEILKVAERNRTKQKK